MNGKRLAAALCALVIVGASAGGLPLDGLDDLAIRAGAAPPGSSDIGSGAGGGIAVAKASIAGARVNLDPDTREVVSIAIYDEEAYDYVTITDLSDFDITYGHSREDATSDVPTEAGMYYAYVTAKNESTKYQGTANARLFLVYPADGVSGTFADGKGIWKIEGTVLTVSPAEGENDVAIPGSFGGDVNSYLSGLCGLDLNGITKIVISDGITSIGTEAFYDVQDFLSSITIAGSVKSIGQDAFHSGELSSVTFISPALSAGDTQTLSMGSYAIGGPSTATVTISGDSAKLFYSDDGTDVEVATGASLLALYNGDLTWKVPTAANPTGTFDSGKGTWEFDQETGTLNLRPTNEGGTAAIPNYFLSGVSALVDHFSAITAIVISDGITSIGEEAIFTYASDFRASSVTIAGSVTSIAARAIVCNSITSVTFNSPELAKGGQQQLSMDDHAFEVSDNATFQINSSADPPVKLYDGEIEIDGLALKGRAAYEGGTLTWKPIAAENLTGTFDDGKGTWEFDTKTGTLNLRPTGTETAVIPNALTSWLRDVYKNIKAELKTVVINDGITDIGNYAFPDCSYLKNVTIADSVTRIGYCAFVGCSSLETVTFQRPASAGETSPSLTIERGVFYNAPDAAVVNYAGEGNLQLYYTKNSTKEFISKVSQIDLALTEPDGSVLELWWADPDQSPSTPAPTYTVTIPSDLTINPTTYKGEAVVKATFANITQEKPLKVTVTGSNPSDTSQFNLKSGSDLIPYTLKCGEAVVSNGGVVLNGAGTVTEEMSVPLTFEVNPEDVYAGTYTDTLTFSISLGESDG